MKLNTKTKEAERLTKWSSEPKWSDLHEDYTKAYSHHSVFLAKLEQYRETMVGGPEIPVRQGKSNVRPLVARKNAEWTYSQLEEPFLSTPDLVRLHPRTGEDGPAAEQCELLQNYYLNVWVDKVPLVGGIVRSVVDDGTVIVKNGWNTEKEKYKTMVSEPVYADAKQSIDLMNNMVESGVMSPEKRQAMIDEGQRMIIGEAQVEVERYRIIKNHPTHEVCDLTSVVIDPTCRGSLSDANFVIHEYDTDYSILMKDKYDPETGYGFYKNLDAIDFKSDWEDRNQYSTEGEQSFVFSDKARKKVKIREYWGYWDIIGDGSKVAIVASWIGEILVRLEKNPFPHGKLPFSSTTYMPVRDEFYGEPNAHLLKDNQDAIGKATRVYQDVASTRAVGQRLVASNTFESEYEWSNFESGNDARYTPNLDIDRAIKHNPVDPIDPAIFQIIQIQQQEAESLSGTSTYNKGLDSGTSGSATGIRTASDSMGRRELSLLRRMSSQLFKSMIRQSIANTQAFASDEEVVRITNREHITIKRSDIQGEFDLIVDVSTPAKNAEIANDLSFIAQTLGDSVDVKVKNMILGDILRLKQRPDLAEQIENFEPQTSEAQMQMESMQLENVQLENQLLQMKIAEMNKGIEDTNSKIQERYHKGADIDADIRLKDAKAKEHGARSEYYDIQKDLGDQRYLDEHSGSRRSREVRDLQFREDSRRELEELKAVTALKNKTVGETK
jgi:hypothetical protein